MGGKTYAQGHRLHASDTTAPRVIDSTITRVVYDLRGEYDVFKSDIGPQQSAAFNGSQPSELSIQFVVLVDSVEVYNSGLMFGDSPLQYVEVDVSGAQTLELQLLDGGDVNITEDGNSKSNDHGKFWECSLRKVCKFS